MDRNGACLHHLRAVLFSLGFERVASLVLLALLCSTLAALG